MPSAEEFLGGGSGSAEDFLRSAPSADDFLSAKKPDAGQRAKDALSQISNPLAAGAVRGALSAGKAAKKAWDVATTEIAPLQKVKKKIVEKAGESAAIMGEAGIPPAIAAGLMMPASLAETFIPGTVGEAALAALPLAGKAVGIGERALAAKAAQRAAAAAGDQAAENLTRLEFQRYMAELEMQRATGLAAGGQSPAALAEARRQALEAARAKVSMLERVSAERAASAQDVVAAQAVRGKGIGKFKMGQMTRISGDKSIDEALSAARKELAVAEANAKRGVGSFGGSGSAPEPVRARLAQAGQRLSAEEAAYADAVKRGGASSPPPAPRAAPPPAPAGGGPAAPVPASPTLPGAAPLTAAPEALPAVGRKIPPGRVPKTPNGYEFVTSPGRVADGEAFDTLHRLATTPQMNAAVIAQKGGRVPAAATEAAGQALRESGKLTAEQIQMLPRRGIPQVKDAKLSETVAALRQFEEEALLGVRDQLARVGTGQLTPAQAAAAGKGHMEVIVGVEGAAGEVARALGATKAPVQTRAARNAAKVIWREKVGELSDDAVMAYMKAVAELPNNAYAARRLAAMKVLDPGNKWLRMLVEGRSGLLVWNPITLASNAVGNTAAAMTRLAHYPLAAAADIVTSPLTKAGRTRFFGETEAAATGMWRGFHDAAADALDILKNEQSLMVSSKAELRLPPAIPGIGGKIVRGGFRFLGATDAFFKSILRSAEAHAFAFREGAKKGLSGGQLQQFISEAVANPSDAMMDAAEQVAAEYTFQQDLPKALHRLERVLTPDNAMGAALRLVVPFFKTPANIGIFAGERLIPGASVVGAIGKGRHAMTEAAAKSLMASASMVSASMFLRAAEGHVTGAGPQNKNEREDLLATGWRPYSIQWLDKSGQLQSVPYQRFEPVASLLRAVATLHEDRLMRPDAGHADRAAQVAKMTALGLLDAPFLKSIGEVIKLFTDPERTVGTFAKRTAASFVPPLAATIARDQDPVIRDPETVWEHIGSRTPGMTQDIRPRVDRFGRPIKRTSSMGGLYDQPGQADPVATRLLQLGLSQAVSQPPRNVGGQDMTPDQELRLAQLAGPMRRTLVEKVIFAPGFENAPRAVQENLVRSAVASADRIAVIQDPEARAMMFKRFLEYGAQGAPAQSAPLIPSERYQQPPQQAPQPPAQQQTRAPGAAAWFQLSDAAAAKYGVDPALVRAVMMQENASGDPSLPSPAGAVGLMQVMAATAGDYGYSPADLTDPAKNIDAGVRHLKMLLELYRGNVPLALAAYNAGQGNVHKHGGVPPFEETQAYVPKVMANYERLRGASGR